MQYQEWRGLLREMFISETGFVPEDMAIYSEPEPLLPQEPQVPVGLGLELPAQLQLPAGSGTEIPDSEVPPDPAAPAVGEPPPAGDEARPPLPIRSALKLTAPSAPSRCLARAVARRFGMRSMAAAARSR